MNPAEAKAIANVFIAGLEQEFETTKKVIAAVPESQLDFKLGDKGRTMREITWHLIASEAWFADAIASGSFTYSEQPLPAGGAAAMVAFYNKEMPAKLAKLKQLSGEQLAQIVDFFGVMKVPDVMLLGFMNNHSIHHRGQLSTYLRAVNAHVPSIYGGSADEPFQMPANA